MAVVMPETKRPRTILIVDDEPDLLEILRFSLEGEGFETVTASNVEDAVEILRRRSVDLILTDVRMPEGDGLQVLQKAKEMRPSAAVILMTGFADVNPSEAFAKGAVALLSKPFDHGRLIQLVREHIGDAA